MKSSKMMIPSVFRANITTPAYYLGFIPGLISVVLGTALSGIGAHISASCHLRPKGIYGSVSKRDSSQ